MKKAAIATILLMLMSCPVVAFGQHAAAPDAAAESKPTYLPGLGEFMLQTQTRHLKLWLAGNVSYWGLDLADYESMK